LIFIQTKRIRYFGEAKKKEDPHASRHCDDGSGKLDHFL